MIGFKTFFLAFLLGALIATPIDKEPLCKVEPGHDHPHDKSILDRHRDHYAEAAWDSNWRTNAGACGYNPCHLNGYIVAISKHCIPEACGRCMRITNGCNSVVVKVTDATPNCDNHRIVLGDVAFRELAPLEVGVIKVKWNWCECPLYDDKHDKPCKHDTHDK